jgi:proteasome alpha subunit
MNAGQLEVAVLDRGRAHRKFRRLVGARLEALLTEARQSLAPAGGGSGNGSAGKGNGTGAGGPDDDTPPASGPGGSGGGPA